MIKQAIKEWLAECRSEIPEKYRFDYDLAISGTGEKFGIKCFCLQCSKYDEPDVGLCTSFGCPLWPYRPFEREKVKISLHGMVYWLSKEDVSSLLNQNAPEYVI